MAALGSIRDPQHTRKLDELAVDFQKLFSGKLGTVKIMVAGGDLSVQIPVRSRTLPVCHTSCPEGEGSGPRIVARLS